MRQLHQHRAVLLEQHVGVTTCTARFPAGLRVSHNTNRLSSPTLTNSQAVALCGLNDTSSTCKEWVPPSVCVLALRARRWAIEQQACYVQRRCVRSLAQMLAPRLPQSLRQSGWQEVKLAETHRTWPKVAGACSGGLRQGGTASGDCVCVCGAATQQWRHMGCLPDMMASGAVWRREGEAPPTVVCCPDATAARFHTRTQPSAAPPATRRGWLARATSTAYSTPAFAPTSLVTVPSVSTTTCQKQSHSTTLPYARSGREGGTWRSWLANASTSFPLSGCRSVSHTYTALLSDSVTTTCGSAAAHLCIVRWRCRECAKAGGCSTTPKSQHPTQAPTECG